MDLFLLAVVSLALFVFFYFLFGLLGCILKTVKTWLDNILPPI